MFFFLQAKDGRRDAQESRGLGDVYKSLGWQFRFKTRLHESEAPAGKPWYIPGYGTRNSAITGSFSIFYTFRISPARPTGTPKND